MFGEPVSFSHILVFRSLVQTANLRALKGLGAIQDLLEQTDPKAIRFESSRLKILTNRLINEFQGDVGINGIPGALGPAGPPGHVFMIPVVDPFQVTSALSSEILILA